MNTHLNGLMAALIVALCPLFVLAADATINLKGKITASACTVDNNGSYHIAMQNVTIATLAAPGSHGSSWKTFDVTLSACPPGISQVTTKFGGTPSPDDPTKHANASGGVYARNVAVQLQDAGGTNAELAVNSTMTVPVDAQRKATFALRARPYSPTGGATIGAITAIITLDFTYN